jgi:hypothetical protein
VKPAFPCADGLSISFEWNSKLSRIEGEAFAGSGLRSIRLPRSVEAICESCFADCKSFASVTVASDSRLQRIEEYAFRSTAVREMTIPGGIHFISGSAFDVETLEWISFCPSSTSFRADGGLLRDISDRELIRYFGRISHCPIANSVEVVCASCFYNCEWLLRIRFECDSRLSRIECEAFWRSGLTCSAGKSAIDTFRGSATVYRYLLKYTFSCSCT